MSGPTVTDWISAGSSVVQTVGALLAIFVTSRIARRGERDSARREQESLRREEAARDAADKRADAAIARAAEAERQRILGTHKQVVEIALHSIDLVVKSFQSQIAAIPSVEEKASYEVPTVLMNWTAADSAMVTLQTLTSRVDDPMVATLIEQGVVTLERPKQLGNWWPPGAKEHLESCVRELEYLCIGLNKALAEME